MNEVVHCRGLLELQMSQQCEKALCAMYTHYSTISMRLSQLHFRKHHGFVISWILLMSCSNFICLKRLIKSLFEALKLWGLQLHRASHTDPDF